MSKSKRADEPKVARLPENCHCVGNKAHGLREGAHCLKCGHDVKAGR